MDVFQINNLPTADFLQTETETQYISLHKAKYAQNLSHFHYQYNFYNLFQGAIGSQIVKGCTQRTCVKKGKKAIWVNAFAKHSCCSYQTTGFEVDDVISSELSDDGCTNITLTCTMKNRKPTITFITTNNCPKPVSEELFNATSVILSTNFDSIRDILAVIMNNTGIIEMVLQS